MRRVYYSYALSVVTHSMFWQGILLGGSVALFGRLTHVAALFKNMLAVPVGNLPQHIVNAFGNALGNGEVMTVIVATLMLALTASFGYHLVRIARTAPRLHLHAV